MQIEAVQMVPRYLAGQLSASESAAFERALSEQPDLCSQIEQILKFKEGLSRLQERGQLDPLLQAPALPRWLPYATAAALAMVALGALLWWQMRGPAPESLALSPNAFVARGHEPPSILGTYVLARTRGQVPGADVNAPHTRGAIELRILPSAYSPEAHYSVLLTRLGGAIGTKLALTHIATRPKTVALELIARVDYGAEVHAPTFSGEVALKIPAGSQSGRKLRLKGKGTPHLKGGGRGDWYFVLQVMVPTRLDADARAAVERLKSAYDQDVRSELRL